MNQHRRALLKHFGSLGVMLGVAQSGLLLKTTHAFAAEWNKNAFESKAPTDVLKKLGITQLIESKDIVIKTPELAENSSVVPIEVISHIPHTKEIFIIVDKNPYPLTANFEISEWIEPVISTRIKMAQTSIVRVIIKANNQFYGTQKEVKITIGGCGS